ncbi:uncharacterized protein [Macaca fascicularis]|uniref:uncharacterized protein n=1 Tax=Macaca fascicularis TaxID=9541 RepID=UPI0032B02D06
MRRERVPGPRRARETWECIPGVPSAPLLPQDSGRSRAPNSLSGRLGVEPGSGSGRYSSRAQPPCSRPYSVPAQHALHPQNHSPEGTHCPTPRRPACPTPQSQNSEDAVPGATLHSPRRPTRTETRLAVSRLTTGSRDDQGIQRLTPRARQQPRRTRPRRGGAGRGRPGPQEDPLACTSSHCSPQEVFGNRQALSRGSPAQGEAWRPHRDAPAFSRTASGRGWRGKRSYLVSGIRSGPAGTALSTVVSLCFSRHGAPFPSRGSG